MTELRERVDGLVGRAAGREHDALAVGVLEILCRLYVPADAPLAKLAQVSAYGATTVPVDGPRAAAATEAMQAAASGAVYASHAWSPL